AVEFAREQGLPVVIRCFCLCLVGALLLVACGGGAQDGTELYEREIERIHSEFQDKLDKLDAVKTKDDALSPAVLAANASSACQRIQAPQKYEDGHHTLIEYYDELETFFRTNAEIDLLRQSGQAADSLQRENMERAETLLKLHDEVIVELPFLSA